MNGLLQLITEKDRWVVEGKEFSNGVDVPFPIVIRFRPHLQEFINSKLYNTRLVIIWRYQSDDDSLLPSPELENLMDQVEDSLSNYLEKEALAVLAATFKGGNTAEWHWYTRDINETAYSINEALSMYEVLPLEIIQVNEPDWDEYLNVLTGKIGGPSNENSN